MSFAHMKPDEAADFGKRVSGIGAVMITQWESAKKEIQGLDPFIGSGLLGAKFRQNYGNATQLVFLLANQLPQNFKDAGDVLVASAEDYRAEDTASAGRFPKGGN